MKRFVLIFCLVVSTLGFIACNEVSHNGDLDGMWQIMEVTYNRNGLYDSTVNIKKDKVYLSFQLHLAHLNWSTNIITLENSSILSRFSHDGDQLHLYNMYVNFPDRDSLITDSSSMVLAPIGFKGIDNTFQILQLNSSHMTLQSDFARIVCRKF